MQADQRGHLFHPVGTMKTCQKVFFSIDCVDVAKYVKTMAGTKKSIQYLLRQLIHFTLMLMESLVKFCSPQNISGASQQNYVAAFS